MPIRGDTKEKYLNNNNVNKNLNNNSIKEILINWFSFTCANANDIGHLEME